MLSAVWRDRRHRRMDLRSDIAAHLTQFTELFRHLRKSRRKSTLFVVADEESKHGILLSLIYQWESIL
jgi:hypothetical protein